MSDGKTMDNQYPEEERESGSLEQGVIVLRAPKTTPMLLPEIWETILTYLKSKDLVSATIACPELIDYIKGEHAAILFPFVVPMVAKYLDLDSILNCRLVNQEAKRTFHEFMGEDFGRWDQESEISTNMSSRIENIRVEHYMFDGSLPIRTFMRTMEGGQVTDCNPFLTGSITIFLWYCPNSQQQEVLGPFLTMFGSYVRSLVFYDGSCKSFGTERRMNSLESLLWILAHLPNLRTLKLLGADYCPIETEGITIAHIPRMKNIEELCLIPGFHESETDPIFLLLQRWTFTLKAVSLRGGFLASPDTTVTRLFRSVPFLKRFEVRDLCSKGLSMLTEILWRLEELQIRNTVFHHADQVVIVLLLKAVTNFSITLVTLKLFLKERPYMENSMSEDEVTQLENEMKPMYELKKLSVNLVCLRLDWFWKFLELSCRYVRELNIFLDEDEKLQEKVDMVQCYRRLFTTMNGLRKITLFSARGKKETIFRSDS